MTAYGDNGERAYSANVDIHWVAPPSSYEDGPADVDRIADDVIARMHVDPDFAAHIAAQLRNH